MKFSFLSDITGGLFMILAIAFLSAFLFLCPLTVRAQSLASAEEPGGEFLIRQIVPFEKFVTITPFKGGPDERSAVALDKSQLSRLAIVFQRNNLRKEDGPQFVKITTTITTRKGEVYDKMIQYAFTFAKEPTPDSDEARMRMYAQQILPFGFVSRSKIDSVDIHLDSLPDWGTIKIEVTPDEEYTKYARHYLKNETWYFRAKGIRWEAGFFLGIPKVLYDSNKKNSVVYGNASAMVRFFLLNDKTGNRYPLNIGVGTFGVSTPIDVSKSGGGFVVSLFLDVVQMINNNFDVDLGTHFNAGLEISPFFPIEHHARMLLSARIGISP
jgi:hypothetical protein